MKTLLLMSSCCDCKELTVFSIELAILCFEGQFVLVQRRGLADFVHTAEIGLQSLEPFVPFLKPLIGSVPIGEGPEDVA